MVSIRVIAPLVAAVALLPAVVFFLDRGELFVGMAIVNVLLIAGCLYTMLSPEARATPA